jgi:hypothetical protein
VIAELFEIPNAEAWEKKAHRMLQKHTAKVKIREGMRVYVLVCLMD